MNHKSMGKGMLFGVVTVLLAGCGSAPSESDVREAMDKHFEAQMRGMAGLVGGGEKAKKMMDDMKPDFSELKLLGCKESESANGYLCDIDTELPMVGRQTLPVRLIKADGDWKVVGDL